MGIVNTSSLFLITSFCLGLLHTQGIEDDLFTDVVKTYSACGQNINIDQETQFIFKTPLQGRNRPGIWPWVVSLGQLSGTNTWQHRCGGSLLTTTHVVTAAHCGLALSAEIELGQVYIRVGDSHLKNDMDDAGMQIVKVLNFTYSPGYKWNARYSDIGVLFLESAVDLTAVSRTICLPEYPTMREEEDDKLLVVIGWGANVQAEAGIDLNDAHVQVYPEEHCNRTHLGQLRNKVTVPQGFTSELFCGGDSGTREGVCHGDSGSPAVYFNALHQKYELNGVVSGGLSCGTHLHPNIYVRVTDRSILAWIKDQISPASTTILIESMGGAAEWQGSRLGFYDEINSTFNRRPVFKQKSGSYLIYYSEDTGEWKVGPTVGGFAAYLKVESENLTPPTKGWRYWKGLDNNPSDDDEWLTDSTVRLSTSPPDPSSTCTLIQVSSTGPAGTAQRSKMGLYRWDGEWLNGHKIFKKIQGNVRYLRVATGYSNWAIDTTKDSKGGGIQSGRATTCPCRGAGPSTRAGVDGWRYSDDGWHEDRSIQVTCV